MASIIQISGTKNKISTPNTRWSITANEACLFEVTDWIPKTTVNPAGGILPVPPAQIELGTRAKVTWELKDKSRKILFKTIKGNVLDKFNFSINKKYSGSYTYSLEATLDGKNLIANTFVSGLCDPKISAAKWSKKEGTNDTSDVKCGNIVYVTLDTEGLNGDKLTFEFFSEKDNKKSIANVTEDCINGDCVAKIPTIGAAALTKQATENFYVKVKNAAGVYIKNAGDEKVIKFKILKDIVPPVAAAPTNNTVLKVGEPDKVTLESTGIISLEKIKVETIYDVCNDEVKSLTDLSSFWILEDKGKNYHWLKKRTNANDLNKPIQLPITLASDSLFKFEVTFKTILPSAKIKIRARDKDDKYVFKQVETTKSTKKGMDFTETFESNGTPYNGTAKYFPNFELIFEYSIDGNSWTPLGSANFCFYLTWKKPLFSDFDPSGIENMQINYKGRDNICETLLWLGCSQANTLTKISGEEQIMDEIFKKFKTLKIIRRREGTSLLSIDWSVDGLGYWRNASSTTSSAAFSSGRSLRFLLANGEARCGEWTIFLKHIFLTQGMSVGSDTIGICTEIAATTYGFQGFTPPYNKQSKTFKGVPPSYQFSVKKAVHDDINDPNKTTGDSAGQGNPKTQPLFIDHFWFYYTKGKRFYDASYGVSYDSKESNLIKYCSENLNSVFLVNGVRGNNLVKPFSIEKSDLHDYIKSTNDLFK
jgi:hypothetical protein